MILPSTLIANADAIDKRLGPISGPSADRIAVMLREAAAEIARLKRIEGAAEQVYAGLNERIDAAPANAKPVFYGIAELHDAISAHNK